MPLASCERCGKMFDKMGDVAVCSRCLPSEEDDFDKIREALEKTPHLTAEEVAEETEVDIKVVLRLIDSGRIQNVNLSAPVKCGRCGAPAISMSKKLCQACLNELNTQLAKEQGKIKMPKRKTVELGTALNVKEESGRRKSRGMDFRSK